MHSMRMIQNERKRAESVAAAVDQLIRNPDVQPGQLAPEDAALLDTARRLARLPALLGPVDPLFQRRVMGRVRAGGGRERRLPRFRPGWAIAGLMAAVLLATLFTPWGQTAVASFMAVFNLGRTEVRITPVDAPTAPLATAAVREMLTLEEAQARVPFPIPQPTYLPPGFRLRHVYGYSYPDLPAWLPRPFFIELTYGHDAGQAYTLRIYPITLGQDAATTGLNLEASAIHNVRDVDVHGQPGVLLQLGDSRRGTIWQELVWEQDDVILSLATRGSDEAELLRIARSVGR